VVAFQQGGVDPVRVLVQVQPSIVRVLAEKRPAAVSGAVSVPACEMTVSGSGACEDSEAVAEGRFDGLREPEPEPEAEPDGEGEADREPAADAIAVATAPAGPADPSGEAFAPVAAVTARASSCELCPETATAVATSSPTTATPATAATIVSRLRRRVSDW
jgi:hypothetical protein